MRPRETSSDLWRPQETFGNLRETKGALYITKYLDICLEIDTYLDIYQEQPRLVLPDESTVVMEVLDKVPLVVPVRVALAWRLLSPKVLSLMCLCCH